MKERDQACVDCGATTLLEYDHVPDFAQTGHTVVDELQWRCAPCHQRRHDRPTAAARASADASCSGATTDRSNCEHRDVSQALHRPSGSA